MVLKTMVVVAGLNQPHENHDTTSLELSRFGEPLDSSVFKELILSKNPSATFLMETKQCDHRISLLRKQCGYSKGFVVNPTGQAGGLCVWWKPEVTVEIVDYCKHWIDAKVSVAGEQLQCRCTWMYGTPYGPEKEDFWNGLSYFNWNDGLP